MEPSMQEWEEHMKTHIPYRTWCPHCCKGMTKASGHNNPRDQAERDIPVIGMGYMCMKSEKDDGDSEEYRGMPRLVMKDSDTNHISSIVY